MEAALRAPETKENIALPAPLADRVARIAWLAARSYGVRLDDVLEGARFNPAAVEARTVAIALSSDLLRMKPALLARYFEVSELAIERACRGVAERTRCDPEFRTTMSFLKSSCTAVLGVT